MAREAHDREDLLRDATAFGQRLQLEIRFDGQLIEVFAGFRAAGAVSVYFGAEPVYHFNSRRQLRRVHVDGRLIKAERGKLVGWQPRRSENAVEMLREEMSPHDQHQFGEAMLARLAALCDAISSKRFVLLGAVPAETEAEIVNKLAAWLEQLTELHIAPSPRVG